MSSPGSERRREHGQARWKIGDVAARAGVATRLVRYYEQQGLVDVRRSGNGYRQYTDADVARVARIAGLVQAGLPTRLVKVLLDAEDAATRNEATCPREVAEQLAAELAGLEARIECLARSRDTIRSYLDRACAEIAGPAHASAPPPGP